VIDTTADWLLSFHEAIQATHLHMSGCGAGSKVRRSKPCPGMERGAARFREMANECLKRSQLATDDEARAQYRNIAENYLVVARAELAREEQERIRNRNERLPLTQVQPKLRAPRNSPRHLTAQVIPFRVASGLHRFLAAGVAFRGAGQSPSVPG
jgi:hypothetical protein